MALWFINSALSVILFTVVDLMLIEYILIHIFYWRSGQHLIFQGIVAMYVESSNKWITLEDLSQIYSSTQGDSSPTMVNSM